MTWIQIDSKSWCYTRFTRLCILFVIKFSVLIIFSDIFFIVVELLHKFEATRHLGSHSNSNRCNSKELASNVVKHKEVYNRHFVCWQNNMRLLLTVFTIIER